MLETETADILEETLTVTAPSGPLPAVLAYPFAAAQRGAVLVVGPHPLLGDSLQNNVVRSLARGMAEHGFVTLRFGYGGAGPSTEIMQEFWQTGHAPGDPVRVDDACAAMKQLQAIHSQSILLVGFSFGSWVVNELLSDFAPRSIVLISPTLRQQSYDCVRQTPIPKLVIMGDNDFATPIDVARDWFESMSEPKQIRVIEAAEHFYRGMEARLVEEIIQWM